MPTQTSDRAAAGEQTLLRRHLLAGWIGLLAFLLLGIALETLHGLKADSYLDTRNATRRLMWTLAHAHGTLFSLVNIAFALTLNHLQTHHEKLLTLASRCLLGGLIILPLGFFAGGCWLYGGDPGIGIFLVPPGAALILVGVGAVVVSLLRDRLRSGTGNSLPASEATRQPVVKTEGILVAKVQLPKKRRDG